MGEQSMYALTASVKKLIPDPILAFWVLNREEEQQKQHRERLG